MLPGGEAPPGTKAAMRVAHQIVERYITPDLEENARLPTEKEMVESFGVARTTLREALRLLEARGVVRLRVGRYGGPIVQKPPAASIGESLTLLLHLDNAPLRAILDARLVLEPAMARLAAERITDEQLSRLSETVDEMASRSDDDAVFAEQNYCFHAIIAEAADSVALKIYLEGLLSVADGTFAGIRYSAVRHRATADAHQRIVEALLARDPEAAEKAMRIHIEEIAQYWQRRYPDLVSKPVRWMLTR